MRNGPPLTPRRIATRGLEILRERGWRSLVFLVLADLGYRRLLLLERDLSEPLPAIEAKIPLDFSVLTPDELGEYLVFHDEDPRHELEARFGRGDECFVARSQGQIVCANWAATNEHTMRFVRYRLRIATGEVYVYDSFTLPAFRGRGVAPALAVHMIEHFRRAGLARATTLIEPENAANLRARAKSGYRVCGRIACLKVGPKIWHWFRDDGARGAARGSTR
jgi:ribosomal protein S18 acetylase RimI-like enzyme